jgi:hypothetical protein
MERIIREIRRGTRAVACFPRRTVRAGARRRSPAAHGRYALAHALIPQHGTPEASSRSRLRGCWQPRISRRPGRSEGRSTSSANLAPHRHVPFEGSPLRRADPRRHWIRRRDPRGDLRTVVREKGVRSIALAARAVASQPPFQSPSGGGTEGIEVGGTVGGADRPKILRP